MQSNQNLMSISNESCLIYSRMCLGGLTAACVFAGVGGGAEVYADNRPNIVFILADDLGYSDLGCYGGEINTPNIDSLAARGLRFRQFYNTARSCPSRASILTGLTPHLAGVGHMVVDRGYDGYHGTLSPNSVTIAEALSSCGYSTAMSGKWHVTNNTSTEGDMSQWPMQRGFQRFYGTLSGHGSFWDPKCLYEGNTPIRANGDYYYTEAITDHACKYIEEMSEEGKPFMLYVAYTAPHYPLHARKEFIDKNKGRYSAGWDSLRVERYDRMKRLGVIPSDASLPQKDAQCYDWSQEEFPEWQQMRMEVYAAMVEQMDAGVGKIVGKLRDSNILDNTIVIFLSDNGPSNEGHLNNTVERTGRRWGDKMIPAETRDGRPVKSGDIPCMDLGADDTYGSYGPQWAHLGATPFKRYKSWMHEGGICAPMIVSWGDNIPDKGGFRDGVYAITDFMPTFLELADGKYPESNKAGKTIPIEGKSFVPALAGNVIDDSRLLFWEHEGNRAVRYGRWKLVSEYPGAWRTLRPYPNEGKWELYDIATDRTEIHDLADEKPELVKELAAKWDEWSKRAKVEDWKTIGGENW